MEKIQTVMEMSAGGVAYRQERNRTQVALISVGPANRWQLPKGTIDAGETPEQAALREVREEGGVETALVGPLETIEYWYFTGAGPQRLRHHKTVHFYLLRYLSGDPQDHDHEVNEARWVDIDQALSMLAFEGEKRVLTKAIQTLDQAH